MTPDTSKTRLLMGVCGSVSVVAVPHLLLWMRTELGIAHTRVVLTETAERILGKQAIRPFSSEPVVADWSDTDDPVPHVSLAAWADVVLVLPATVNALGKFANGIADDLLSSVVVAAECPVVVVPATNEAMWAKAAVRRNVAQLRADGFDVVEPKDGIEVADGSNEFGSLGDYRPAVIKAVVKAMSAPGSHSAVNPEQDDENPTPERD